MTLSILKASVWAKLLAGVGDWGIEEMVSLSDMACNSSDALPKSNGCIEFEICNTDDQEIFTFVVDSEETECGTQLTTISLYFEAEWDCEDNANDDENASGRASDDSNSLETIVKNCSLFTVEVSPNPASDVLYIKTSSANYNISITDINGKLLQKFRFSNDSKLDVSNFITGMYLLVFDNGFDTSVQKVIIE